MNINHYWIGILDRFNPTAVENIHTTLRMHDNQGARVRGVYLVFVTKKPLTQLLTIFGKGLLTTNSTIDGCLHISGVVARSYCYSRCCFSVVRFERESHISKGYL